MRTKFWRIANIFTLLAMLINAVGVPHSAYAAPSTNPSHGPQSNMQVITDSAHGISKPLSQLAAEQQAKPEFVSYQAQTTERLVLPKTQNGKSDGEFDTSILQDAPIGKNMPTTEANFDGVSNLAGVLPPDTQGEIGFDPATGKKYYVQWVNLYFQIWDVTNPAAPVAKLAAPVAGNTLFSGLGSTNICAANNDGDPITLYDHLANRWMMSQFALGFPNNFHQCIAISATGDPTGAWYLYDFQTSAVNMNDYPHFGVWPDGYYMTVNQFNGSTEAWAGAGVAAFERSQMLQGMPARMVYINTGAVTTDYGGMLPSDLDGPAPAVGTPNYFMEWDDSSWITGDTSDNLRIWAFHVDWANTANSTFGTDANYTPNYKLATTNVDPVISCGTSGRACISQLGTTVKLDAILDRLMYRLQYRNFGTYSTLVVNHTVDAATNRAGIHWFELRNSGSGWSIYQQSVYSPDTYSRWMGSTAMDDAGNMALGYSVSSSTLNPSIRYSGRLASDALNSLPQGESTLIAGTGSQTSTSYRWGDYSMLGLDPQDGCTFWYTNEYYSANSSSAWKTRIGSFKFPSCTALPTGNLNGTVTDGSNPIAGVNVDANGYVTVTDASGHYSIDLPAGTYTVTASKYGYSSSSASGVVVATGSPATQDFTLGTATFHTVSGVVTNSVTGWPVYASITVGGYPNSPIFTDPITGAYNVSLADGGPYIFTVNALGGGYSTGAASLTVSTNATQNFSLTADLASCTAPGYNYIPGTPLYSEGFNPASGLPTDWTSTRTGGTNTSTAWTTATATVNPSGVAPYEGTRLVYFNSWTVAAGNAARLAKTTGYDLSAQTNAQIVIYVYHDTGYSNADTIQVQVSTDGTTWNNVGSPIFRYDLSTGWKKHTVDISAYTGAGMTNVRPGFNATSQWGNDIHIDNMAITNLDQCNPYAGLVVGAAYDANTSAGVSSVTVTDGSHNATWVDNSLDAALPHPFYITGEAAGSASLTASAFHYATDTQSPTVVSGGVVRQDFHLPAGSLSAAPSSLNFSVTTASPTDSQTTNLANAGGASADYEVFAIPGAFAGYAPTGPYADNTRHLGPKNLNDLDATGLRIPPEIPDMPEIAAAGNVTASWSTGLAGAWGLGFNTEANDLWLGNALAGGGDNKAYRFTTAGTNTGETINSSWVTTFGADMTYNPFTNKLWQVNVGGDNCIYEMDPISKVSTGNKMCPAFGTSERGLAFDPLTNTYYAGSWNDYIINHFAPDGTILDSKVVSLSVAGLAYNPSTKHLFVLSNTDSTTTPTHYDVTVLDTANSYAVVGGFNMKIAGVEAFANNTQSALEIDCNGSLWASSYSAKKVFVADSGETGVCNWQASWLSGTPATGTVSASGSNPIAVNVDAASLSVGNHYGYLRIVSNTPYAYGDDIVSVALSLEKSPDLTVTGSSAPITYGDTPSITPHYDGFIDGDDASVLNVAPTCTAGAGPFTVAGGPYTTTCSGGLDDKYDFVYVNGSVPVNAKTLDVTANNKTIQFGQPEPTFDFTAVGFVEPDAFVTAPTCAVVEDPHTAVGTYTIACSGGDAGSNYSIAYHNGVFTIVDKFILTVTASSASITYGDPDPSITPSYSGFVDGDTVAVLDTAPTCAATTALTVANSPVPTACSGGVDTKYDFSYVNGAVTVAPKTVDVTANNKTISFGDPEPTFDYTATGFVYTPVGHPPATTFITEPTCAVVENPHTAPGAYTIACSGGDAGSNYSIAYHNGVYTIRPILTVTASSASITYGDAAPSITPQYSGFIDDDDASVLDVAPTCTAGAGPFTVVGSPYTTSCSGGSDAKYDFNYVDGSLTVNAKTLDVTANNKAIQFGQPEPTFDFTAVGFVEPDTFVTAPTCAVVEDPHTAVGSYTIACSGGDAGSNYSIAYHNGVYTVSAKPILTVTASSTGITYGDAAPSITPQYSGFVDDDDASVLDVAPTCTAGAGPFTVAGSPYPTSCSGGSDAKYDFNYVDGSLTVAPKAIAVTAEAKSKVYGEADPTLTYTFTPDLVSGDAFSGSLSRASGEDVGSHAIEQGSLSLSANYTLNYTGANLTITQATLTATADDKSMFSNATDPVFTVSYSGFVNGDDASALGTAPTCTSSGDHSVIGTYPITCSGGVDTNYTFEYEAGVLTVHGPTFADAGYSHWAWNFIEALADNGVTGGCGGGNYCPNGNITRAQMAVFILRAKYGEAYVPPTASGTVFNDVAAGSFAADYIEALADEGITGGCGSGNYCPNKNITRAEMAVFILRGMYGDAYTPPTAGGDVFNDVAADDFAAAYIEALSTEGITGGCGSGNYCPNGHVTRAEMAVFLVAAFDLPIP